MTLREAFSFGYKPKNIKNGFKWDRRKNEEVLHRKKRLPKKKQGNQKLALLLICTGTHSLLIT